MFALLKRYRHVAAVTPLMLAMIATASAQAPYPNRNITLVLPFAPSEVRHHERSSLWNRHSAASAS